MDKYERQVSKYNKASNQYVNQMKEYDSYSWYHPVAIYHTATQTSVDDYVTVDLPKVKPMPSAFDT